MLVSLLLLNIIRINSYCQKKNFINPIYFIPVETIYEKVNKSIDLNSDLRYFAENPNTVSYYMGQKYFKEIFDHQLA